MELYGVTDRNHRWIKSYLSNRKQFTQIDEKESTSLETVSCWTTLILKKMLSAITCILSKSATINQCVDNIRFSLKILLRA